ncbi:MAG TPA: EAL domain-containing protein [Bradyrhizobium sp.]|nr:EAL domain-containing protein [Bradyrhizobium sp.]
MKSLRPTILLSLIVLGSLASFGITGHFAAKAFIGHQQSRQLNELADTVVRRSELAVDFAAASLDELASRGLVTCDAASLQAIRLHVYQRSAVKDVRLVNPDGSVICSAYSETLEFDKGWADRSAMLVSANAGVLLFRVEQFGGDALGVLRDIDRQKSVVAILGINSSLLDIMPAELRGGSEVVLGLNNGEKLGQFSAQQDRVLADALDVVRTSSRYPFQVTIHLARGALSQWNNEIYWPAISIALALGLVFGLLLTRIKRLEGPVADLDRALLRNEFKPFFQPTFDLHSGEIVGCEVLARWITRDGSVIPPMNFIPLAESSGRIQKLTWQILSVALKDMRPLLRQNRDFKLSVNVVPSHLLSVDFIDTLRRVVMGARVSARQIVLEITERDELHDLDHAAGVVRQLRDYGFRVAIDDVGVGHSGLSHLKGLGANIIKIDKFFVDTITEDASTAVIVEMLVRLAQDLHMGVIAEGIETEEQKRALLACGVTHGQGYLVAPPLPFEKFLELLSRRAPVGGEVEDTALVA